MQESAVNRLLSGQFNVALEKAWQVFKHQAQLAGCCPQVRFSAEWLPAYYHSEVTMVDVDVLSGYILKTSLPALSGCQSTMPRALFKEALSAHFELGDQAPLDFFDTFNNRYFRLYCQVQTKHDLTAQIEEASFRWNQHRLSITAMLANLAGQSGDDAPIPVSHLIQYTGLLGMKLTCPLTLKALLEDYFAAEFAIERSELEYLPLTPCSLTQIGGAGQNRQLGMGALVGKTTPMAGQKLNIKICPKDYNHYLAIRHDKAMIRALDHLVRSYMGVNTKYALYMKVNSQYLPRVRLSSHSDSALRIGQSAWMNNQTNRRQFVEMPLTLS
ncbi:type VI secretion system baseplate subunit TssG [Vibrio sp. Vb2110]|uniref:type VI secretion system baseplate subunit TssG n=1 Tax=unclassified Vibrio TaxID=2614977 RepID=UPI0023EC3EE9|nr:MULTISPECIES: type VI secretion system baseplate subunit TssG [unclassified Vibrio]MDF4743130.1 type VI secretion system baseplate subunit TssG [Vibrio parahaemolyticus]MDG3409881.1 type VI secretion system baseplate subunit TssG [Vibrio parahaemolyticus]MDW1846393.1 type VI secretion system baseplate subunit TssG [Vibrio sp. Vb2130]MDW1880512.1 type VI secretion system baseplate subunit TssG [Vibrio sp. Vb2110]MDW2040841.1 type VI secretion system baseplate subunit TssG [Vibrio sp. 2130-1]